MKHIIPVFYTGICDPTIKQGLEKQPQVSRVFSSISKLICDLSRCICNLNFQDRSSFTVLDFPASAPLENIPCAHCNSLAFILIPTLQVQI